MKKGTKIKTAFDEYTLIEQVGSGGNGRVFSANNENGDLVAIKFVERNISSVKLRRFKNEIFFCERNKHKNIVEVLDHGCVELNHTEYVFYVMPLYKETLRARMNVGIKPEQAVEVFSGLLEGLAFAHKNKTIHRDIKPENIMFKAGSNDPVICDFGIAHFAEEDLLTFVETKKGDRMANFQYAAPEQRNRGEKVEPQTDIYAAGLILNEMFTGEIPLAADYKTISMVTPEYGYLDDVFSQLYRQKPLDRLYPEDRILTEMKILAENHEREVDVKRLRSVIENDIHPEDFHATIIEKRFRDGKLVFTLDCEIPQEWYHLLGFGRIGGYSSVVGYGPEKLEKLGRNSIYMPLRGHESKETITNIVKYVSDWVPKANAAYNTYKKEQARDAQREREKKRKAEIEKLERETSINNLLASL